jgi:transcriptional regulator with XRE-family HTH domain
MTNNAATIDGCSAVALETLRGFLADRIQSSSERVVAMETGLSRSTLTKFVRGETQPHPRTQRLLAAYYLAQTRVGEEEDVDPRRAAIGILFPGVPEIEIVAVLEELYTEHGMPLPYWMARIRELAA